MSYSLAFAALWIAWLASWGLAAFWASRAQARPSKKEERFYWLLTLAGAVLIVVNFRDGGTRLVWTVPTAVDWGLFAVATLGLGFTWWARLHLGTLWSGRITRKADHRIIDTGPYGLVRHPIYTGILVAIYASVLLRPGLFGLLGAALITASFIVKARLEERFLTQELGPEAYEGYRKRVPMLVPFWRPVRG